MGPGGIADDGGGILEAGDEADGGLEVAVEDALALGEVGGFHVEDVPLGGREVGVLLDAEVDLAQPVPIMEAHVGAGGVLVRPGEHGEGVRHGADQAVQGDGDVLAVADGLADPADPEVVRRWEEEDGLEMLRGVDVLHRVV